MQKWYALSDPGMENALLDIEAMRRFAGRRFVWIQLGDDAIPDETTLLNFRRLLDKHQLTAAIMNTIIDFLEAHAIMLKGSHVVDTTIILAHISTKNKKKFA